MGNRTSAPGRVPCAYTIETRTLGSIRGSRARRVHVSTWGGHAPSRGGQNAPAGWTLHFGWRCAESTSSMCVQPSGGGRRCTVDAHNDRPNGPRGQHDVLPPPVTSLKGRSPLCSGSNLLTKAVTAATAPSRAFSDSTLQPSYLFCSRFRSETTGATILQHLLSKFALVRPPCNTCFSLWRWLTAADTSDQPRPEPTRCLGPHPLHARPGLDGPSAPRLPARRQPLARRVPAMLASIAASPPGDSAPPSAYSAPAVA